jgi:hypothetical protein
MELQIVDDEVATPEVPNRVYNSRALGTDRKSLGKISPATVHVV